MSRSGPEPRFTVADYEGTGIWIYDDDFGYDAAFLVTGDWHGHEKLAYAQAVCDALNAANIPARLESETEVNDANR